MDIRSSGQGSLTTSMVPQPYVILGSGGFAAEVFWNIFDLYSNFFNTAQNYTYLPSFFIFADDTPGAPDEIDTGKGIFRVEHEWRFDREYQFVVGVDSESPKRALVVKAISKGLTPAATVVHPSAVVQNARIGVGGVIAPGCVITTNITIGDYVIVGSNSVIGLSAMLGNFRSVPPCSVITGTPTILI